VKRRQSQNLNNSVLKNKIAKDLYLIGKNSIKEIFNDYHRDFESLIVSETTSSEKVKELISLFHTKQIPVFKDSGLINHLEKSYSIDTGGSVVILKRAIGKFYSLKDVRKHLEEMEHCTIVALPEIDFEQNIGAMIRTSLGLNVDMLLVSNRQQKVFTPTVTKVSMGYNLVLPIVQENFLLAIEELKDIGFDVLALDMGGENITNMYYNPKTCFVMGNEASGVSQTVLKKCDKTIAIPMSDRVESLNVATSLGIVLYDRVAKTMRTSD
jgi:23S rRNA (guanosine2251-2'-O)-methyltransferase